MPSASILILQVKTPAKAGIIILIVVNFFRYWLGSVGFENCFSMKIFNILDIKFTLFFFQIHVWPFIDENFSIKILWLISINTIASSSLILASTQLNNYFLNRLRLY